MNFFKTSLNVQGYPMAEATAFYDSLQKIPSQDHSTYVEKAQWEIVNYHRKNTPFYAQLMNNVHPKSWEDLPVLRKKDLQIPLRKRLSNEFVPTNIYKNKTSGSSGHPFIFGKDKFCHALTWVKTIDWYQREEIEVGRSLEARFYGIPLNIADNAKERIKDFLSARVRFPIFDLSQSKLDSFLKVFERKPFVYINGYTSSVVLFAKYLDSRRIYLKSVCPTLKKCIVTSEMLFDEDRYLLENTFGVPVINEYGASELGIIGFSKSSHDFVLDNDTLFMEVLDDNDVPVSEGESGKIVITSLYNKAHPMIRYEIGDYGIIAHSTDGTGPILKKLVGRTNDFALLPGNKKVPGLTFYYVTKSIIEEDGKVTEFVVRQSNLTTFKVIYVSKEPLVHGELKKISAALEQYVGSGLNLNFNRVATLDRGNRGKLKQFVRDF